jgi:hypothetical protein
LKKNGEKEIFDVREQIRNFEKKRRVMRGYAATTL